MSTRAQQIQHIQHIKIQRIEEFAKLMGHRDVESYFVNHPHDHAQAYEEACEALNLNPLRDGVDKYALEADSAHDRKNPKIFQEYAATLEWAFHKLKNSENGINLQDLYSDNMEDIPGFTCPKELKGSGPGDITLYRAFNALIACGAADGISPYARDEEGERIHTSHLSMNLDKGPNLDKIKTIVIAKTQDYDLIQTFRPFSEDWEIPRKPTFVYLTEREGVACTDEAFQLLNIPESDPRADGFSGPSMSVGDIVETKGLEDGKIQMHLCKNLGWESKDVINLRFNFQEAVESLKKIEDDQDRSQFVVDLVNNTTNPTIDPTKVPTVEFLGEPCTMEIKQYENGRTAIQLWCEEGPMAAATKNVPEINLEKDEILVPNYSEFDGMPYALEKAGVGNIKEGVVRVGPYAAEMRVIKVTHPAILAEIAKFPPMKKKKVAADPGMGM